MDAKGLDHSSAALLEDAAEEIARLDAHSMLAPECATPLLRTITVAQLTLPQRATFFALCASQADELHNTSLAADAARWKSMVEEEERLARGGAALSISRFSQVSDALATYPERARLEGIWREPGRRRPVLVRALDSAAWMPSTELGEVSAALILCGGGRTDRVRLLPFAALASDTRAAAIDAWREGDTAVWAQAGLSAATLRARALRDQIDGLSESEVAETDAVEAFGRAGITARRVVDRLRTVLAATMPSLADTLTLSRPPVSDAIARLEDAGLVREITGRARDRVYALEAVCAVADTVLEP